MYHHNVAGTPYFPLIDTAVTFQIAPSTTVMSSSQGGPHLVISSDNRAAYIVIVTATGLSWTLLTLIIRIVSKLHVKRTLGLEEALVIAASVCTSGKESKPPTDFRIGHGCCVFCLHLRQYSIWARLTKWQLQQQGYRCCHEGELSSTLWKGRHN